MKLKKTLSIIIASTLAFSTMVGCGKTDEGYLKEISKVEKWEATNSNVEAEINVEANGESFKLNMNSTAYTIGKDKGYANIKLNDPKGKVNIPEMKVYFDKDITFINKDYYESMYKLEGKEIPKELADIKAEYLGFYSKMNVEGVEADFSKSDSLIELGKSVFANNEIKLPYVQNGREYSLNLDSKQMMELVGTTIKTAFSNIDIVNATLNLGLKDDMIKEIKAYGDDKNFDKELNKSSSIISGSSVNIKDSFTDDSYKQNFNINFEIKDAFKASIKLSATTTKSKVQEINIPNNSIKLTNEQMNNLQLPDIEINNLQLSDIEINN